MASCNMQQNRGCLRWNLMLVAIRESMGVFVFVIQIGES